MGLQRGAAWGKRGQFTFVSSSQARASSTNTGGPKRPCPLIASVLWLRLQEVTWEAGGRAVTRDKVMGIPWTTLVRVNPATEPLEAFQRRVTISMSFRNMCAAAEGRMGWRELSRRPGAQVGRGDCESRVSDEPQTWLCLEIGEETNTSNRKAEWATPGVGISTRVLFVSDI